MIHQLHLSRRDRRCRRVDSLSSSVPLDERESNRRRYVHLPKVTKHPWPMRSTNQTSGHQTSNHQPSSAGLPLFGCATRIEGVQPTRSSAGLLLIECATRIEGVQPTTVCGSASFGAQAISTRSLCCQLGPRNWQIHVASTPDSITSDGMWICQFRGSSCSAQGPCAVSLGPETGRSTYTEPEEYVLLQTLEHCSKTYSLVKFRGPSQWLGPRNWTKRVRFCYSGQHTRFHHELSAAIAHFDGSRQ